MPGQRGEAGFLQPQEVVAQRHVEAARAFGHLERGEPVHVDRGRDRLHRARDVDVVVAVEVGMDTALQADLGRAALDRLDDAALHLLHLDEVRLAPQVERERALRERAELALERADVRVVDVAVADERDLVADDVAAELVGDLGDLHDLRTARAEQRRRSRRCRPLAPRARPSSTSPTATARATARGAGSRCGRVEVVATRATTRCRGRGLRGRTRRAPAVRTSGCSHSSGRCTNSGYTVRRGREHEAGRLGRVAQAVERGPRPFGVHVVDRDRRDAAPVVDARRRATARGRRSGSAAPGGARRRAGSCGRPRSTRGTRRSGTGRRGASRCRAWAGSSARSPLARARARDARSRSRRARRCVPRASRRCRRGCPS